IEAGTPSELVCVYGGTHPLLTELHPSFIFLLFGPSLSVSALLPNPEKLCATYSLQLKLE
ncbi:Uncharacterized protein DAT39_023263, partial [Clarias magur]